MLQCTSLLARAPHSSTGAAATSLQRKWPVSCVFINLNFNWRNEGSKDIKDVWQPSTHPFLPPDGFSATEI